MASWRLSSGPRCESQCLQYNPDDLLRQPFIISSYTNSMSYEQIYKLFTSYQIFHYNILNITIDEIVYILLNLILSIYTLLS